MADKYQDRREAKAAAYRSPVNPFPEGSRLHRYFISARKYHDQMEDAFRDLETVYGTIGTRRTTAILPHDGEKP